MCKRPSIITNVITNVEKVDCERMWMRLLDVVAKDLDLDRDQSVSG